MSNRSKRVKVAKLLKEHGLGRLYNGNKKAAWKLLGGFTLNDMLWKLQFKPGDVVNDCDGANHIIAKWLPHKRRLRHWAYAGNFVHGWVFEVDQFEDQDGRWSCGCPYHSPESAVSREEIEKDWQNFLNDPEFKDQLKEERYSKIIQVLANGEHICDEQGILLSEFKR